MQFSETSQRWLAIKAEAEAILARLREKYDENEPRDEGGKWTSGGGGGDSSSSSGDGDGKGKHPGPGYSKGAYMMGGVIYTKVVADAQRALSENRKVELNQPRKLSILINRLGKISKDMIAKGEAAPNFNLCNVSVEGTSLFCQGNKDIPRVEMPQLDKQQTKDFRQYLKDQGYKVKKDTENASYLHATQNEINGAKVAATAEKIKAKGGEMTKRLIISKDNYVLDGHHHWAAKIGLDAADNKLTGEVKVSRVNISITKLLQEAEKFTGGKGKKPATESASYQPATKVFCDDAGVFDLD